MEVSEAVAGTAEPEHFTAAGDGVVQTFLNSASLTPKRWERVVQREMIESPGNEKREIRQRNCIWGREQANEEENPLVKE